MQFMMSRRGMLSSIVATTVLVGATGALAADPKEIADQVYQAYVEAMTRTNAALEGFPEPTPEIAETVDAIKEDSVTKLVALGHEIAAMSEADRKTVEGVVSSSVSSIHTKPETKDVYAGYQAVWGAYVGGDQEFFNKIKSLNILTQYAFFDLLRKQEPEEADRLGV